MTGSKEGGREGGREDEKVSMKGHTEKAAMTGFETILRTNYFPRPESLGGGAA